MWRIRPAAYFYEWKEAFEAAAYSAKRLGVAASGPIHEL
jgi:hypothetical protein